MLAVACSAQADAGGQGQHAAHGRAGSSLVPFAKELPKLTHIARLQLSTNRFGDDGLAALGAALPECKHLLELDLDDSHESVTDVGVEALIEGLSRNRSLLELDVGFSSISDAVWRKLFAAVDAHETLRHLRVGATGLQERTGRDLLAMFRESKRLMSLTLGYRTVDEVLDAEAVPLLFCSLLLPDQKLTHLLRSAVLAHRRP